MMVRACGLRARGGETVQTARNFPAAGSRGQHYSQKLLKAKVINSLLYSIHNLILFKITQLLMVPWWDLWGDFQWFLCWE